MICTVALAAVLALVSGCSDGSESDSTEVSGSQNGIPVAIEVECDENLIFSRYDVDIYVDESLLGTLDHGATATYDVTLSEGNHTLRVASQENSSVDGSKVFTVSEEESIKYIISCKNDQVEINEASSDATSVDSDEASTVNEEPVQEPAMALTSETSSDLARLLSSSDTNAAWFSQQYAGQDIRFDGYVADLAHNENYNTRWNVLILAGDYGASPSTGPNFRLSDVSIYDMNVTNSDSIRAGDNITITATVGEYDEVADWLELNPISIEIR